MAIQAKKAVRQQVKLKIALIGPSGAGKTYSALKLARGIGGKVLLVNTEGDRGYFYADEFDYDIVDLEPPFTPERYMECIEYGEKEGYDTIILDSGSHEWSGRGGILEIHENMPGNSYTNWSKLTPRHNQFIDKQLYSKCHIINCLRGKDQYVLEEKNGKQVPKKVGMGPEQRSNYEYEFAVVLMIDQESHVATATKDNTHIFENKYEKIDEEHGALLAAWAKSGVEAQPKQPRKETPINYLGDEVGITDELPFNTGPQVDPETCVDCGAKINKAVITYSMKYFNRPLCRGCQDKAKKQSAK